MIELVEAAARTDQPDVAAPTVELLVERTQAGGTDWALGIEARSRALLSTGRRPTPSTARRSTGWRAPGSRVHLARAHLVYGDWLRREQRRADARGASSRAYQLICHAERV
jgi:hypothetical protein